MNSIKAFKLAGKVAVITGGAGLLGMKHAEAILEAGGCPILWDIKGSQLRRAAKSLSSIFKKKVNTVEVNISKINEVKSALYTSLSMFGSINILINNAANNPTLESDRSQQWTRFENFLHEDWDKDLSVGLTGAYLCSQAVGTHMSKNGGGVILNIASDLSVIAPDQRLYKKEGIPEDQQPVKPVTYSVVKHGLIGLTKYLSSYWAEKGVRANAISPGGVYTSQSPEFVEKITELIPQGRMATKEEYKAAVVFLCSDASAYMTGQNLVMDGGRSVI